MMWYVLRHSRSGEFVLWDCRPFMLLAPRRRSLDACSSPIGPTAARVIKVCGSAAAFVAKSVNAKCPKCRRRRSYMERSSHAVDDRVP